MAVDTDDELANFGDHALLGTIPVLSERAATALAEILRENGKLLPLMLGTARYFAFNVTTVVNALDTVRAKVKRFSSGRITAIDEFAFIADIQEPLSVFKIPELKRGSVFVTDTFVDGVHSAKLVGFEFQDIWADSDKKARQPEGRVEKKTTRHAHVEFNRQELEILNNALNEVCHGLDIEEFSTRLGADKAEVPQVAA